MDEMGFNEKYYATKPTFEKEEAEATYKYMLEDTFVTEYKNRRIRKMICDYLFVKNVL